MGEFLPETCFKFALAVVLAGAVGLERERKGRAAGLRTHILVCLGATLAMIVANLVAREAARTGSQIIIDKGRIAAGIITGIGFLGAGTIMHVGSEQRGLTTAAMIWFVAALGITIGAGYYAIATAATAFALSVVLLLKPIEHLLPSMEKFTLSMRLAKGLEQVDTIERAIRNEGFQVMASRIQIAEEGGTADITFNIRSRSHRELERLAQVLQQRFENATQIVFER